MNPIPVDMVDELSAHKFEGAGGGNHLLRYLAPIPIIFRPGVPLLWPTIVIGQLFAPWDVQRPLFTGQGRLSGDVPLIGSSDRSEIYSK
jgi:hypothetical protein